MRKGMLKIIAKLLVVTMAIGLSLPITMVNASTTLKDEAVSEHLNEQAVSTTGDYEAMLAESRKCSHFIIKELDSSPSVEELGGIGIVSKERFALGEDEYVAVILAERVCPDAFVSQVSDQVAFIQPDYELEILSNNEQGIEEYNVGRAIDDIPSAIFNRKVNLIAAQEVSHKENIVVALIDTGVDTLHPALENRLLSGWDFVHDTPEVKADGTSWGEAHGTLLAGIIADTAPNAAIMPLVAFNSGKAYTSDIVKAIQYAENNGAQIVNCSWGGVDENVVLREAVRNSNMLFITAAGNNRSDLNVYPVYPASYQFDNVITATALNADGGLSYFSNYGESVDIAAWGRDVESSVPGGGYDTTQGTSVAAAFVTGGAALMADGVMTAREIKETSKTHRTYMSCVSYCVLSGRR